jgi:photosystem II stability/assembly factor-like uncharacterized protein
VNARRRRTQRQRGTALGLVALFALVAFVNHSGDRADATPAQGTFAGTACGAEAQASLGYCLVALSFLGPTSGYGLSAPGPAGSPLVLGRTTDAGISWSSRGQVPGLVSAAPATAHLHFTSTRTGFAWGQGTLDRTADGGAHWTRVQMAGRFLSLVNQGPDLWAVTTTCAPASPEPSPRSCGIHVARSRDGGASWSAVRTPPAAFGQGELAVAGESIDLALWEPANDQVGSGPRLLVGSARGTAWTSGLLPCPAQDQFPGELTAAPGTSTLWLVCQGQADAGVVLYQSSMAGPGWVRTFSASGPDGEGFALDANLEALQPTSTTRADALTQRNGLLITTDGGRRWSAAATPAQTGAMSGFLGTLAALGSRNVWVALWTTLPNHPALFHTTDGGSSWLSPVLAGAPPITFPAQLPSCRSAQLEARFYGTEGEAGSWLSTIDIADDSPAACVLQPPATLELLNGEGLNERSVALTMGSAIPLTRGTQVPPLGAGVASGTQLASILVSWPTMADANALLGGDGADVCPVSLFTPAVARLEFGGNSVLVVTPTDAATSLDPAIAPTQPMCGWRLQAQVSPAAGG